MVRVISVHHFTHQDVTALDRAGGHGVACGKDDLIFIGGEHKVDVRDLKKSGELRGSFPTVDLAQQLIYCQNGNYVCTLESKPARHGGDHTYVRVYLNWESEDSSQPMRARIAGRVTPSGQSGLESLEMVEIPTKKPVEYIACCQTTGNIALASGMSLTLFRYCMKTHEMSKVKFVDFDEIIEIDMAFVIKEIAIAEDLIGCVSDTEAHIFQVVINAALLKNSPDEVQEVFSPEEKPKSQSKSKSRSESRSPGRMSLSSLSQYRGQKLVQKESYQLIRDADEYVDLSELQWVPTICYGKKQPAGSEKYLLFPSLVGASQCGTISEPGEILGPVNVSQCSNVRIKLLSGHGATQRVNIGIFDAVTLLHRKVDQVSEPDLPFSNLKLICVYDEGKTKKVGSPRTSNHPLLPIGGEISSNKVGATVFLTTPHIGCLYHITLQSDNTKDCSVVRGGVFSYTAPVDTVALEPYLLHALTLTGLETYTIRPHPHIIETHLPGNHDMIVPPHWEESVCLVGLRPFLNVESLTLTHSCLALIAANDEGGDKSHTVYSLHLPSAGSLYKEMIRVGLSHRTASPSTYLHLLLEAHIVLMTALKEGHEVNRPVDEEEDLVTFLQDSSSLLGDYYANCSTEVEWNQAVQYYNGSSLTPDAIIERLPATANGLVFVLTSLLLDPASDLLTAAQANAVLETLEKTAPYQVSIMILKSNCLKDFKKDRVLNIIKQELSKTTEPRPSDVLALALIILERGSREQVSTVLALLRSHQLVEILLAHSRVLFDHQENQLKLSHFAQVLMECKKEVFTETFVLLVGQGTISLDAFVEAYSAVYPIVSCGIECNINSLRLIDLLENFFLEYGHLPELTDEKEKFAKSITVLVSLYLASFIGAFNFENDVEQSRLDQRSSRINIFGERPSYLNHLPPFEGKTPGAACKLSPKKESAETSASPSCSSSEEKGQVTLEGNSDSNSGGGGGECLCKKCCVHILFLQSLLASDLPSPEDRATVYKFATSHSEIKGASSLNVLCLEKSEEQQTFLLDHHPKALIHFCKDAYDSPWEWEGIVCQLIDRKDALDIKDPNYEVVDKILNEILAELVMTSSYEVFTEILPKSRHEVFRGHIRQCHSAGIAQYLKETFVAYADNVLQQMAK